MYMIIFYVFFAAESEFDIRFSPSRLDFAVQEVLIHIKNDQRYDF